MGSLLHGDVSVRAGAISDDLALITSSRLELCKEVKLISQVRSAEYTQPQILTFKITVVQSNKVCFSRAVKTGQGN